MAPRILGKADILAAPDLRTETVEVPEWGGAVIVRNMSGTERDAFESSMMRVVEGKRVPEMSNMRAKLLAMTIVDEGGKRVFESADIDALGNKSAGALERVFDVAQRLNGMSPDAVAKAEKNSEPGPSDASISA